jgi:acyl-CoA hydrolase
MVDTYGLKPVPFKLEARVPFTVICIHRHNCPHLNHMKSGDPVLPPRKVADSRSEMTELVLPNDANTLGNLLGGRLMHYIDLVGAMAAYRHARAHVVTASMDHIDFIAPVHVGDLLILKSTLNRAFRTSMEVGVKVWVEHTIDGTFRHVASAYLTFVAVDAHGGRVLVPPLELETEEDKRRYHDAGRRREQRFIWHMRKHHRGRRLSLAYRTSSQWVPAKEEWARPRLP